MANKKASSSSGNGAAVWLVILGVSALAFVWVVISPAYLMKSLTVEREFSVSLGGRAADQWIYGKMIEVSYQQVKDIPASIKQTSTMPDMMRKWAQERIIATWLWASLVIYRANMMLLYFFILIPFLAAISLDGIWAKEITTYSFSSQSPRRHRFGVLLSSWTMMATFVWLVLPAPIPSAVAPLAIVLIGFASWMWLANLQKRI